MNAEISIVIKSFEVHKFVRSTPRSAEKQPTQLTSQRLEKKDKKKEVLESVSTSDFGFSQLGSEEANSFVSCSESVVPKRNVTELNYETAQSQPIASSFFSQNFLRSVRLPKKRTLYSVLRSPHIDKKSREQFEMKTHKLSFFLKTKTKYLRNQLFFLKLQDLPGVQCKIVVNYRTRLKLV